MSQPFDEAAGPDVRPSRATGPRRATSHAPDDVAVWWLDLGHEVNVDGGIGGARRPRRRELRRSLAVAAVAHHLGVEPASLRIDRTCQRCGHPTHGKPRIVGGHDVSFSVASRDQRAVVAIAGAQMAIGVDLERLDPTGAAALYEVALTPAERGVVSAGDVIAITRLWCRKEALLKAAGGGLVGPGARHAGRPRGGGRRVVGARPGRRSGLGRGVGGCTSDQLRDSAGMGVIPRINRTTSRPA